MVNRHTANKIRKTHRYLGIFIGIQFLFWTISGLYFSWTNIDDIHGDQYRKEYISKSFSNLISPSQLDSTLTVQSVQLKNINNKPYYWINNSKLFSAETGVLKKGITKEEAKEIASQNVISELKIKDIQIIKEVGKHHEYRERLLPAYVISYMEPNNLKAYVSFNDGSFQTIRHRDWRWFDFLWMTHTMDYEGRDNMNNLLLRAFSFLGLITVLSGFLLWFTSSPTIRKFGKKINN
ncbi:PepSY domain-containing protein [Flavobacterium sp.]|uniref:PepSY domain-containing protein n=2 Tax=Flavobacterium sp. TaxID=239 RepID=UPI00404705E9